MDLPSFATLFVINRELKVNYLTSIDEIVVKWHEVAPWLSTLDEFFALVLAMAFVLTNMWVLVPTIRRREKEKKLFMQTPNHRKFQITLGVAPERKKRSVFFKSVICYFVGRKWSKSIFNFKPYTT